MPGLYGSTTEKDIETFVRAYSDPYIKPDEIKFYPTAVIPNTPLYDLYRSGEYTPITEEAIIHVMREVKTQIIPPYTRIKRLIRDIPASEVAAGHHVTNLRQLVMRQLTDELIADTDKQTTLATRLRNNPTHCADLNDLSYHLATLPPLSDDETQTYIIAETPPSLRYSETTHFVCLCTRCREIQYQKNNIDTNTPFAILRRYRSSVGDERFVSIENQHGYLYGLIRLLLPLPQHTITDYPGL